MSYGKYVIMATIDQRLVDAGAHLVKALTSVRSLLLDDDSDLSAQQRDVLSNTCTHIRNACGTPEAQGLLDLLGMMAQERWLDDAFIDGRYDGYTIYRYDGFGAPRYSARELTDPESGVSFWHISEKAAVIHLIATIGAQPDQDYQIVART